LIESGGGMVIVETIGRVRREHFVKGKSIKEIARDLEISRNTFARSFARRRHRFPTIARFSRVRSSKIGAPISIGF